MKSMIVDFSIKREVFFIMLGSVLGAFVMFIPNFLSDALTNSEFYMFWIIAARTLGSSDYLVGIFVHFGVATIIGIVVGVVLYKTKMLNISKISNGLLFGILAGAIVTIVFTIPVQYFWIQPVMADLSNTPTLNLIFSEEFLLKSFLTHFLWGGTLGVLASVLTTKKGMRYRCHKCDIEFSKLSTYEEHYSHIHVSGHPDTRKIVILGGGYAGVGVLERIQKRFEKDVDVGISIISENNYFLHTPMLPELSTGTIEPRHIATPIRNFCKRARFYQAKITNVDLEKKSISFDTTNGANQIPYDYLVIAAGTKTGFFGNENLEKYSITIKSLQDASIIRNQIITQLELADQQETANQAQFLSFVIVGGGFSGVETAGEINEFIRESAEKYYRNIESDSIHVYLIAARDHILPEIGSLGKYAAKSLEKSGVKILYNTKVTDANPSDVSLSDDSSLHYSVLIWAGGNQSQSFVKSLDTEHDKSGRILVDQYLRLPKHSDVFALGDCAFILDPAGKPYPPTAQHAIREAKTVSKNLISTVRNRRQFSIFDYSSKGSMAKIGKRDGVAKMLGINMTGFAAWFVWKQYYLSTLPVMEKRIRVGLDWFVDLFFTRDITKL